MTIQHIFHLIRRVFFAGSLALFALALIELGARALDISITGNAYAAGRLIEMAAALTLPAIMITLRDILVALKLQ